MPVAAPHPEKITIIGLGLMGGSLSLAARARGIQVAAYARSRSSREIAKKQKIADSIFDSAADAVTGADLIILCTPIFTMPQLVGEFMRHLKAGAIITDVGSTKAYLTQKITPLLADTTITFIGSHPMTGSEKSGADAARADLYTDAPVIITKETQSDANAVKAVTDFWRLMGAKVTTMTAEQHDNIIARTSHLPHLAASLLMTSADRDKTDIAPYCGPGIKDATRIAAGSAAIWHDIIKSNRPAVLRELTIFSESVNTLKDILQRRDFDALRQHLEAAARKRKKLDSN